MLKKAHYSPGAMRVARRREVDAAVDEGQAGDIDLPYHFLKFAIEKRSY